jgi:transcriptional regulator with XRE-family HTH domain
MAQERLISTRLGELIRARRIEEGYSSQEMLAAELGVTQPTVSAWERGEAIPTLKALVALSRVLGIRMRELAELVDDGDDDGQAA